MDETKKAQAIVRWQRLTLQQKWNRFYLGFSFYLAGLGAMLILPLMLIGLGYTDPMSEYKRAANIIFVSAIIFGLIMLALAFVSFSLPAIRALESGNKGKPKKALLAFFAPFIVIPPMLKLKSV